ncbi:unnamed protein product [Lampetra fluviatilis]
MAALSVSAAAAARVVRRPCDLRHRHGASPSLPAGSTALRPGTEVEPPMLLLLPQQRISIAPIFLVATAEMHGLRAKARTRAGSACEPGPHARAYAHGGARWSRRASAERVPSGRVAPRAYARRVARDGQTQTRLSPSRNAALVWAERAGRRARTRTHAPPGWPPQAPAPPPARPGEGWRPPCGRETTGAAPRLIPTSKPRRRGELAFPRRPQLYNRGGGGGRRRGGGPGFVGVRWEGRGGEGAPRGARVTPGNTGRNVNTITRPHLRSLPVLRANKSRAREGGKGGEGEIIGHHRPSAQESQSSRLVWCVAGSSFVACRRTHGAKRTLPLAPRRPEERPSMPPGADSDAASPEPHGARPSCGGGAPPPPAPRGREATDGPRAPNWNRRLQI